VEAKEFAVTIEFKIQAPNGPTAIKIAEKISAYIYRTDGIDSDLMEVIEIARS
jgi:hypothetical protein